MTSSNSESRVAAVRRTLLNSLKRNNEIASIELDIPEEKFQSFMDGSDDFAQECLNRAIEVWPVNKREFFAIEDDTINSYVYMSAADSKLSERCIARSGIEYFNYRDSAMSSVSPIRPELVEMLVIVDDNDPLNKLVQWNSGHFFYQITYFVGDVNFYFEENGEKKCVEMTTGDSSFLGRYIPHSFTKRNNSEAFILALTFAGPLYGDAQNELSILPSNFFGSLFKNIHNNVYYPLNDLLSDSTISLYELAKLTNIEQSRLEQFSMGKIDFNQNEITLISNILNVNKDDLTPVKLISSPSHVLPVEKSKKWNHLDNIVVRELAGSSDNIYSKAFEFSISCKKGSELKFIDSRMHQFYYNVGDVSVSLVIKDAKGQYNVEIEPHGSIYIKPFVSVQFSISESHPKSGKILVLRASGTLFGSTLIEALGCGMPNLVRLNSDLNLWYK
ncbi:hypothetical protein IAE30_07510 [Pantoea sp. S61]|uniref:hypothetical protein n=1 Tax=Pantoea sp. S61 TaxID=2767442 RepID=UPI00190C6AED|nr:hypothetical protein [Pantoea sp. S61]MBK0123587.1 hypothetical protein [Pantoea sp. S61]